jgi:DNA repair protein NreA
MNIPKELCLKCKGRLHCKLPFCPILKKNEVKFAAIKDINQDIDGSAPSVFVGHFGYPNINVGIMSTTAQNPDDYDAPKKWAAENKSIQEVVDYRSGLINSRFKVNIKEKNKFLETSQEIGMATQSPDVEINLKDKPKARMSFNPIEAPSGPSAELNKVTLTENTKVDRQVEKVVSDTDFKATGAMNQLFDKGFDENFLTRMLSIGNLGMKKDRRLVPTRWAITAVDDSVGKEIIDEVKEYGTTPYTAYFGGFMGNYFLVLMMDEVWGYELFEMYAPKVSWNLYDTVKYTTDHEFYDGRKNYAEECTGGYYASRLSVLERLRKDRKQSSVLVLRFITDDYLLPLGVWVVREATRKSIMSKPLVFDSKDLMLNYARSLAKKKFNMDITEVLGKSKLLERMKSQNKLSSFF